LPGLRHDHVQGETNENEFDRELFEPTNIVEDGEEDDRTPPRDCTTKTYMLMMME